MIVKHIFPFVAFFLCLKFSFFCYFNIYIFLIFTPPYLVEAGYLVFFFLPLIFRRSFSLVFAEVAPALYFSCRRYMYIYILEMAVEFQYALWCFCIFIVYLICLNCILNFLFLNSDVEGAGEKFINTVFNLSFIAEINQPVVIF